ncbi:MAG TPA: prolipoprotein diacylglyceryl transferase [Ignavibacteriaceae bacterium]|nr:prolipoprotein diacylglyceryl transferase [Ignavibacteriaceae bacterium]
MHPELFKIGPFTVYSFGLMLGIAFIVASFILTKEFERRKLSSNFATEITLFAIIFGIIGSKLFSIFENWDEFINDPAGVAFNPGGLTFYGGLILSIIAIWIYVKRKKIPFLVVADLTAPSLALAYGIGRIGCHLAGDGDYGIPTSLPWGTDYSNGTVPPSSMFRGTEIAKHYPGGFVPDNTPLHPTPVYEFLIMLIIFFILWKLRKKNWPDGKLFTVYLVLAGIERLSIEFIRLNPRILFGLTEAQLISILMIIIGTAGIIYYNKKKEFTKFVPLPEQSENKAKVKRQK